MLTKTFTITVHHDESLFPDEGALHHAIDHALRSRRHWFGPDIPDVMTLTLTEDAEELTAAKQTADDLSGMVIRLHDENGTLRHLLAAAEAEVDQLHGLLEQADEWIDTATCGACGKPVFRPDTDSARS
jgi:hypothetical protein